MKHKTLLTTLLIAAVLAFAEIGFAGTHTWTGNGPNGLWSTPSNWENNNPPFANESPTGLIFPATASRRNSTNNIVNLQVGGLVFDGAAYTLHGTGGGTNITFITPGLLGNIAVLGGTGHSIGRSIQVTLTGTNQVAVANGSDFTIFGRLTGGGGFAKTGDGYFAIRAAVNCNYAGAAIVRGGELFVHGAVGIDRFITIPSAVIIGETNDTANNALLRMGSSDTIATNATVVIHHNGTWQLGGNTEHVNEVTLNGGEIQTTGVAGTGNLQTARINAVEEDSSNIAGRISGVVTLTGTAEGVITVTGNAATLAVTASVRGGNAITPISLVKRGNGDLLLSASNNVSGNLVIEQGKVIAHHAWSLGATNLGAIVKSNAALRLWEVDISSESLTLEAGAFLESAHTEVWRGPVILAGDAFIKVEDNSPFGKTLYLHGKISGPGGFTKTGDGVLFLGGLVSNTYSGRTSVEAGQLHLSNFFGTQAIPGMLKVGGSVGSAQKRVQWLNSSQVASDATLWVDRNGVLDLTDFNQSALHVIINDGGRIEGTAAGALTLNGPIHSTNVSGISFFNAPLRLGPSATNIVIEGMALIFLDSLAGAGGLSWDKTGGGQLAIAANGTYPGLVRVREGSVLVNGALPAASLEIAQGLRLSGTGQVARVNLQSGWLAPSVSIHPFRLGELTTDNLGFLDMSVQSADVFSHIVCGTQPKLDSKFQLAFQSAGYNPPDGQSFILLRNDSGLPVSGTFKNMSEGEIFKLPGDRYFRITYQGGDGNDVVVTRVPVPIAATLQPPKTLAEGKMQVGATGTPGAWYEVHASENLNNAAGWHSIGWVIAQPDGTLSFTDNNAGSHPIRFYRFSPL